MRSLAAFLLASLPLGHGAGAASPEAPLGAEAKVLSVSFISSHRVLSDYRDSYRRGGTVFTTPEWTPARSLPITHTGGQFIEATVVLKVEPAIQFAAVKLVGQVRGEGRIKDEALVGTGVMANGSITAQMRSVRPLPKGIYREALTVDWSVDAGHGLVNVDRTGPHTVYVTLGPPLSERDRNEDIVHRYLSPLPPGVTCKRMEAAMRLVEKANAQGSTETHALVAKLMTLFPEFLLSKGSHFINDAGGAWLLADAVADSGECQAIVRLVKAVVDMVGAQGKLEIVKLYADPDKPTTPIELPWGTEQSPPARMQMKLARMGDERRGWGVALLTTKPPFPDAEEAKPGYGDCWQVGSVSAATDRGRFLTEKPNNFLGCLKVTAEGTTLYYGGGLGGAAFTSKAELFATAFWGMVWSMVVPFPVQDRVGWDEQTTAAMKRIGISSRPPKPRTAAGGKGPNEGFRMMEIIHIFSDDRCR